MTEKGCDNCYYTYFDERAYPCSLCIRGIKRTDQWQPSKKTKAQTCDTCKWGEWYRKGYDITMMSDECGGCCSWNNKWKPKDEPQTPYDNCQSCLHWVYDGYWYCECNECRYEPKDEPQTDYGDFAGRLAYERGVKHAWEVAQKVFDSTVTFYEAEDVAKQISKTEQTDYKKWEAPPKVDLPTGEITTCVSVLASALEYEPETERSE